MNFYKLIQQENKKDEDFIRKLIAFNGDKKSIRSFVMSLLVIPIVFYFLALMFYTFMSDQKILHNILIGALNGSIPLICANILMSCFFLLYNQEREVEKDLYEEEKIDIKGLVLNKLQWAYLWIIISVVLFITQAGFLSSDNKWLIDNWYISVFVFVVSVVLLIICVNLAVKIYLFDGDYLKNYLDTLRENKTNHGDLSLNNEKFLTAGK